MRANALAEAQPCPSTGTTKGLRGAWEENTPAKLLKGKERHPQKIFGAKYYPPCPPDTSVSLCRNATGARAQKKKKKKK